jgi:hypothetical protein
MHAFPEPLYASEDRGQSEALKRGSELLGFADLKPQQYAVGAVLDALHPTTGITMPRRAAKTTSILAWLIGMCDTTDGLKVAYTMATTGKSARDRFVQVIAPPMEKRVRDGLPAHVYRSNGSERVQWENGSLFQILAMSGDDFRSKEFDIVCIDEAGEAEPEESETALAAVLPTMDTSSLGMLILAGTAGEYRVGNMLWDELEEGRAGRSGILEYAMPDDTDTRLLRDWSTAVPLLEAAHPGIGTLTTLERIQRNWTKMKANVDPSLFAAEYGGIWGNRSGAGGLFTADQLAGLYLQADRLPDPPRRFALAASASDTHGSIVAAWREDGEGRLLVLAHRPGRAWLPIVARDLSRRYRVPVVVDPQASQVMQDVKQALEQLRPAARVAVQTYEDVGAAHERMKLEIEKATIRHYGQDVLTDAFVKVRRQQMGAKWKFGRVGDEDDITAAQAATLALRYYDAMPRAQRGTLEAVAV